MTSGRPRHRGRTAPGWPVLAALALAAAACGLTNPAGPTGAPPAGGTGAAQGAVVAPEAERGARSADPGAEPAATVPPLVEQLGEDVTADELLVPPAPPAIGSWGFIDQGADGPVVFDACRPIRYRLRVGPGPADARAIVTEAVTRVSEATGLRFVYDGEVDAAPTSASFPPPESKVSITEAFSPVVIGWAGRDETDLWASHGGDTLGVGGPRAIVFPGEEKLSVSGFALVAPSDALAPGFGPGITTGNVLLHELGHLVGLDHVEDRGELMQARLGDGAPDGWGPGDRAGLWQLGASRGCASSYLDPTGPG